jgi:uncharacterized protein YpmB
VTVVIIGVVIIVIIVAAIRACRENERPKESPRR